MNEHKIEDMTPIEQKQIRGITFKNLWGIVISTAIVVYTVLNSFNSISNEISSLKKDQEVSSKVNELKIREMEARMSAIEADNKEIHYRLHQLETTNK